jgi:hypothetical protein
MSMISTCPRCQKPVSLPSGVDSSAAVRCPLCDATYPLEDAFGPTPPELILVVSSDGPLSAISDADNEAAAVAKQFSALPATPRRRRKPKSALQTLIEVVAGGLAGCLVAYYLLAFYYGPGFRAKGFPELPLPGISWITAPRAPEVDAKDKSKVEKPVKTKSKAANDGGAD